MCAVGSVGGVCVCSGVSRGCVCVYTVGCVSAVGSVVGEEACSGVSGVCVCAGGVSGVYKDQWCMCSGVSGGCVFIGISGEVWAQGD